MAKNMATKRLEARTSEKQSYLTLVSSLKNRARPRNDVPTFAEFTAARRSLTGANRIAFDRSSAQHKADVAGRTNVALKRKKTKR